MRAALLLLALGCSASFDDELLDAASAWDVLEMCPAQLYVTDQAAVASECRDRIAPEGHHVEGCAKIARCEIYVSDDLDPERREQVVLHELGHLLKGSPGHLDCSDQPGDDVMCPAGAGPGSKPTERDRAFVQKR